MAACRRRIQHLRQSQWAGMQADVNPGYHASCCIKGSNFARVPLVSALQFLLLLGETAQLNEFMALFQAKKLTTGTEILLFWNVVGDTEVLVTPTAAGSYVSAKPELRIRSLSLCRGLFEIFLGSESAVPAGRQVWAVGARSLLESDNVKRNTK